MFFLWVRLAVREKSFLDFERFIFRPYAMDFLLWCQLAQLTPSRVTAQGPVSGPREPSQEPPAHPG